MNQFARNMPRRGDIVLVHQPLRPVLASVR